MRGALTCRACHAVVAKKRDGGLAPVNGATIALVILGQVKIVCACSCVNWYWIWAERAKLHAE